MILLDFFRSLRTALWLLIVLLGLLLYGSFVMPKEEIYSVLNSMPLFRWIKEASMFYSWWLVLSIVVLCILTINTIICSFEAVIKRWDKNKLLLIISPQIIHIGFLLILVAHLYSSSGGMRAMARAFEGSLFELSPNESFRVKEIKVSSGAEGFVSDLRMDIEYLKDGEVIKRDYIAPNKPSLHSGFGIYIKDAQEFPMRVALIEVSKEPGAIWALAGGVVFCIGNVLLLILKMKREG